MPAIPEKNSPKKLLNIFFQKNHKFGRKHIFDHFIKIGSAKKSLHKLVTLLFNKKKLERKSESGRKPKNVIHRKSGGWEDFLMTDRAAHKKGQYSSKQYISCMLIKYTNIRCIKKIGGRLWQSSKWNLDDLIAESYL